MKQPHPKRTLLSVLRPQFVAQWHPDRNHPHHLNDFHTNSTHVAWWVCDRGHTWKASIRSRCKKVSGCRKCALAQAARHGRTFAERRLSIISPEIAATWHPTRNGILTPDNVSSNSRRRVWWQCPNQPAHVWITTVNNRQRSGCPQCAPHPRLIHLPRHLHRQPLRDSHPQLAALWHPTLNSPLTPTDVTAGSKKKVWWTCPRNPEHCTHATIYYRARFLRPCTLCLTKDAQVRRYTRQTHRTKFPRVP